MMGLGGPTAKIVIIFVLTCASVGLLWALWSVGRAVGRRMGLRRTAQGLLAGGLCMAPVAILLAATLDRLSETERICKSELLKAERMAGTTSLTIDRHFDFWTKTISGGGPFMPWVSPPYRTAKVEMEIRFFRDGRPHRARIECLFTKVANSGDPPEIAFEQVSFSSEDRLSDVDRFEPWHPPKSN